MKKGLYSLLLGTLLFPLVSFLHECGHYVVAHAYHVNPTLHIGQVTFKSNHDITTRALLWICAAGPLVNLLLSVGGFLWLRHRRRLRSGTAPTRTDCLGVLLVAQAATIYVLLFVTHLIIRDFSENPGDAEKMSLLMEMPVWLIPALLASVCLVLSGATIRLFPRGNRFVPFGAAVLGGCTGHVMQIFCNVLWDRSFT